MGKRRYGSLAAGILIAVGKNGADDQSWTGDLPITNWSTAPRRSRLTPLKPITL